MTEARYVQLAPGMFADPDYVDALKAAGLTDLDAVFAFSAGEQLVKSNLAAWRSRTRFALGPNGPTVYLKRYTHPPRRLQLRAWFEHGRRAALADFDRLPGEDLARVGIAAPKVIACGVQWGRLFERRSFILTEQIPGGRSLESRLPGCFYACNSPRQFHCKRDFIMRLADLARRFHATGCRHRDFYLAHIFLDENDRLVLIDLQRAFVPRLLGERFRIKDIAQLHYSAPGRHVTRTDRLRFYKHYVQRDTLTAVDRRFLRRIAARTDRMARHDRKHGRPAPFAT